MVLENNNEANEQHNATEAQSINSLRKDLDTNFPTHQLPFSGFIKSTI